MAYQSTLDAVGVSDADVRDRGADALQSHRIWQLATSLLFLFPLSVIGAPIHLPLALLLGWGGNRFAPRKDVIASTKLIVGVLLTLVLYGITLSSVLGFFGVGWALVAAIGLPVSGLAFVSVLTRVGRLAQISRLSITSLMAGPTLFLELKGERAALRQEIDRLVSTYLPPDMERLYAPVAARDGASPDGSIGEDTPGPPDKPEP